VRGDVLGTHPERFPQALQETFAGVRDAVMELARLSVEVNNLVEVIYKSQYDERVSVVDSACRHLMMAIAEFDRALS